MGSGISQNASYKSDADATEEEQLLARLAEINAKKQRITPTPPGLPFSGKYGRSSYNQVDLWGAPQERPVSSSRTASSNDFIVPRHDDVNSGTNSRSISFLTKPLVIDKVEDASYENLITTRIPRWLQ